MPVKSILSVQTDFTGEFPVTSKTRAMWRFNEESPVDGKLADTTANGNVLTVSGWSSATSAVLLDGRYGRYCRINIVNPTAEKTHFIAKNNGSLFKDLGEKILVGGWINPTTYSVGGTYCPIFNTRQGPGHPILYVSLYQGKPRTMLYDTAGALILDEVETPSFTLKNNGWYFISVIIGVTAKTSQLLIADRDGGAVYVAPVKTFTGTLNANCTADIILGMHADTYWFAGGLDEWFFEADTAHTIDTLRAYIIQAMAANGNDTASNVDAVSVGGAVILRKKDGEYPESGTIVTMGIDADLTGAGRISVTSQYTAGVTSVSQLETSTSANGIEWSVWQPIGTNGELLSPNNTYIRYKVTLTTKQPLVTPQLFNIQLFDIPIPAYAKLGFTRPLLYSKNSGRVAVLDNAYDIIVTSEVNGAETLNFKLPFKDDKRAALDNEQDIEVANETYRIRTVDDERSAEGITTQVYAESVFYDLGFSEAKFPKQFTNALPLEAMQYALAGTLWHIGDVTVNTRRTWQCDERNALAILRKIQEIHGGDLVFDSASYTVHLLTFSGRNNSVLFAYQKNMTGVKRTVDTKSLATRVYAFGENGMTFASINGGKPYVEDYSYTTEIRNNWLDCSSFKDPSEMLEFARMRLGEYSRPRVSYVLNAMDLSVLTGYEHEQWSLGDIVTVDDREMGITLQTRIIRREYNLQEPWNTKLELSSKLRELGNSTAQSGKIEAQLTAIDGSIQGIQQDIRQMVPFNHLLNSRADSGFANWLNSGFEIDTKNGVTGTASFKAVGHSGTKYMEQTIYPDNRNSYTISAQIAGENLEKGANGMVGIEVVIEYDDGTTETKFIDCFTA